MEPVFERLTNLKESDYQSIVYSALWEDHFYQDITSKALFSINEKAKAEIICKQEGILCGLPVMRSVFYMVNPHLQVEIKKKEGEPLKRGEVVALIEGELISLLAAERVALNFLSFLSGIATKTHRLAQILSTYGIKLLDTRKTIPGLRILSKYAVAIGGGYNHRLNLATMGMIKDNHLKKIHSLSEAVKNFRKKYPNIPLEIEVETLQELKLVLPEKPDIILLDNMSFEILRQCVQEIKAFNKAQATNILIEASGGFSEENIHLLENSGVDFVSMGKLTNAITPIDFSMEVISSLAYP